MANVARQTRSRYRTIQVRMWGDEKFRHLSPIPPCGQGLWIYLLTGPHTGPIPGLFRSGIGAIADELKWSAEDTAKAFAEVLREGIAQADFDAGVVWIPKAVEYNKPQSPNVVLSWANEWDLMPECGLKFDARETLRAFISGLGEPYAKAFVEAFGKPSGKTTGKSRARGEQEQEQEQEFKKRPPLASLAPPSGDGMSGDASAVTPAKKSRAREMAERGTRLPEAWLLPRAWGEWAMHECGFTEAQVREVAANFADYWHAEPGAKGVKLDWLATWRNRCRFVRDRGALRNGHGESASEARRRTAAAFGVAPRDLAQGEVFDLPPEDCHVIKH